MYMQLSELAAITEWFTDNVLRKNDGDGSTNML
jgi:hypothetical protein